MLTQPISLLRSVILFACLAPAASADGFGVTFNQTGKHSACGFQLSLGCLFAPAPPQRPVECAPVVWVPGHYETTLREVWIGDANERVWCGPVFEWRRDACGRLFKVLVSPGRWQTICTPGHSETRRVEVWVPAHWQSVAVLAP